MDESVMKEMFAQFVAAHEAAIVLVTGAIAEQVNPELLAEALRARIEAAKVLKAPELALRLATSALIAAESEVKSPRRKRH